MKKKKILLVGGCGFIGHNLALYLKYLGHTPVIVDSLKINNLYSESDSEVSNIKLYNSILKNRLKLLDESKIKYFVKDAKEFKNIKETYSQVDPEIIIHLAAVSHANKSNKDPHTTFENSFRTLETTLEYAKSKKLMLYLCPLVWFMEILKKQKLTRKVNVIQLEFMEA